MEEIRGARGQREGLGHIVRGLSFCFAKIVAMAMATYGQGYEY